MPRRWPVSSVGSMRAHSWPASSRSSGTIYRVSDITGTSRSRTGLPTSPRTLSPVSGEIRAAVRELCARYPDAYWRDLDGRNAYPTEFVDALTRAGWLGALVPQEFGGAGLGV